VSLDTGLSEEPNTYEIEIQKEFLSIEKYWQSKNNANYVKKCRFFLEAFGVNGIDVGYEEAIFVAN